MNKDQGIFSSLRNMGTVASTSASFVKINLAKTGLRSGTLFDGTRYGLGEVGEFVLIESEQHAVFGRITEIRLPDSERLTVDTEKSQMEDIHPIGFVQLLATVSLVDLQVTTGIQSYPRLGDSVYSSPHEFNAKIPMLMNSKSDKKSKVLLNLGFVKNAPETSIEITPEKMFGRHCAILGATGGGKSFTVARLLEESASHNCKQILLDATGEYRGLAEGVEHYHIGVPVDLAKDSKPCSIPPTSFEEQDFVALFEPSGRVQGPKLREAIRSLKIMHLVGKEGSTVLKKENRAKEKFEKICLKRSKELSDPRTAFDPLHLVQQLEEECVYPSANYGKDPTKWGDRDDSSYSYCLTLLTRISGVINSAAYAPVFSAEETESVHEVIADFLKPENPSKILRICLSGIEPEYSAREILTNAIGRHLLKLCRNGSFRLPQKPVVVFLDEAHGFIGKSIGNEDYRTRLDSFEVLAKEGRKYGLNLCLATQRPRDLPEGVISQMGTLLVHRLTNERDREMVERACGELDRSASSFLPNLQPGEVVLLGVDFPIPMSVQIKRPKIEPCSEGSDFQTKWNEPPKPEMLF